MAPPVAPVLLEKVEESMRTCTEYQFKEVSDNLTAVSIGWPTWVQFGFKLMRATAEPCQGRFLSEEKAIQDAEAVH